MHNFLAEIPNFFLQDGGLTTYTSEVQSKFANFKSGKKYYMDIVLQKNKDMVMYEGPAAYQYMAQLRTPSRRRPRGTTKTPV